jgi:hypothetical protein
MIVKFKYAARYGKAAEREKGRREIANKEVRAAIYYLTDGRSNQSIKLISNKKRIAMA